MKPKKDCCEKYKKRAKLCKDCPLAVTLEKKERKKLLRKYKKKRKKSAAARADERRAA